MDERPEGSYNAVILGDTKTENLRSMFHLVTWKKELGGAGIMPGHGEWENVKSVFPIHNKAANRSLLSKFSRKATLSRQDLDEIRSIYGEKVCLKTDQRNLTVLTGSRLRSTSASCRRT